MAKARELIQEVVRLGLAPMLKKHGFKKNGLNFARRSGTVAHYLNVQLSSWNCGSNGYFYLNAGLMFDEISTHFGKVPPQLPKYDDCNFMVRLDRLNGSLPLQFTVDENTNLEVLAQVVANSVEQTYVIPLEEVDCLCSFAKTGWVKAISWGFPALYYFLSGDKEDSSSPGSIGGRHLFCSWRDVRVGGEVPAFVVRLAALFGNSFADRPFELRCADSPLRRISGISWGNMHE